MKNINYAIRIFAVFALITTWANFYKQSNAMEADWNDSRVVIDIKANAIIRGDEIKISDIATVKGKDIDLSVMIDNIVLGNAPWPGNRRTIGLGEIMTIINNRGLDLALVRFEGANAATVAVQSLTILGEEIAKHGKSFLRKKMSERGFDNVIIELQQVPRDQIVPLRTGDVKLKFQRIGMGKSKKQAYLPVSIMVDGKAFKNINMMFNVNRYENVVVAKSMIKTGRIVNRDSVELENVETTQLTADAFYTIDEIVGKVAKKTIYPGAVLTNETVGGKAVVKRGDNVIILIKASGLEVTAKGVCQEDGDYGDMIKVINSDTRKVLYGNVLDGGTVNIQL